MEKLESAIAKIEVNDNTFENTGTEVFPSYINFFFGANGVGKSTLAQMIRDDSGVVWKKGMSREAYNVLVYNQDFIERNFSNFDNLAGVFTVHEKNIADQKKQEELKAKLKECEESGAALNKEHEKAATVLEKATEKFHDTCWSRTASIREQFEQVFKGKGRKKLIADAILEVESPAEHDLGEIQALYGVAFDAQARPYRHFARVDVQSTHGSMRGNSLLGQSVISSSDTPFASFIKAIHATDWVRQGHDHYAAHTDGKCPYCQQILPPNFEEEIATCFDAQYLQDVGDIKAFQSVYISETNAILETLRGNLAEELPIADLTQYKDRLLLLERSIQTNQQRIEGKVREPSSIVALEDIDSLLIDIGQSIDEINSLIAKNNMIVNDKRKKQGQCAGDIWEHIAFMLADVVKDFRSAQKDNAAAEKKYNSEIAECRKEWRTIQQEIGELNKSGVNTDEAIDRINTFLHNSGFQGFKLRAKADTANTYEVIREGADGRFRPVKKLSEGERNFIAFLYFYQLVRGNGVVGSTTTYGALEDAPEGTDIRDKIVVIDDPVSSMDGNAMFLVGSMVRELISVCYNNTEYRDQEVPGDYIKQIFIMTHNAFFHRAITMNQVQNYASTNFYMIRKAENRSSITLCTKDGAIPGTKENYNPVQNSYSALWVELKRLYDEEENSTILIKNISQRILDYYFLQLCGLSGKEIRKTVLVTNRSKFVQGDDQTKFHLADALLQYISQPMGIGEDIFITEDDMPVELHRDVFKLIFDSLGQGQHYEMMMSQAR